MKDHNRGLSPIFIGKSPTKTVVPCHKSKKNGAEINIRTALLLIAIVMH